MAQAVVRWDEIISETGSYREGFVRTFHKYEGRATDERDGQGRVVKVTMASFARHAGIDESTFRRWVKVDLDRHSDGPAPAKRTNGTPKASGSVVLRQRPVVQAQRSVNTVPEDWDRFKSVVEDTGSSPAAVLGQLVEDYIEQGVPYPTTDEERDAKVGVFIDGCGVDDSFNEALDIVTHWLDGFVKSIQTEEERLVLTRLLKRKLNQLEKLDLKKQKVHTGPRLEGTYRELAKQDEGTRA